MGSRPFEASDRPLFFGRTRESDDVRNLWLSNRLLVLYGRTGVGKTSLVQAGVLPDITASGARYRTDFLPIGRLPAPNATLRPDPDGPNPYVFRLLSFWRPGATPAQLAQMTLPEFLSEVPATVDGDGLPLPLLVAIDQFERVFSDDPGNAEHVEQFLDQLARATERVKRLRVLISIRSDHVSSLLRHEARIGSHYRARYELHSLDAPSALAAVAAPVRRVGREFAPGVAERMVTHLRTTRVTSSVGEVTDISASRIEPVHLQVACAGLWRSLPSGTTVITAEFLRNRGTVEESLRRFCTESVDEVAARFHYRPIDVWAWLARTFLHHQGRSSAAYQGVALTGGLPNAVALAFESRRVLRSEVRFGSRWFELAHEALARAIHDTARQWTDPTEPDVDSTAFGYLRQAQAAFAEGREDLMKAYALEAVRLSLVSLPEIRREAISFLAQTGHRRAKTGRRRTGALDELTLAVRLLPADIAAKVDLARALRELGQAQGALAMLSAALIVAPDNVEALLERGLLHASRGADREARADLHAAIRLDPEVAERADVRGALARTDRPA